MWLTPVCSPRHCTDHTRGARPYILKGGVQGLRQRRALDWRGGRQEWRSREASLVALASPLRGTPWPSLQQRGGPD